MSAKGWRLRRINTMKMLATARTADEVTVRGHMGKNRGHGQKAGERKVKWWDISIVVQGGQRMTPSGDGRTRREACRES